MIYKLDEPEAAKLANAAKAELEGIMTNIMREKITGSQNFTFSFNTYKASAHMEATVIFTDEPTVKKLEIEIEIKEE